MRRASTRAQNCRRDQHGDQQANVHAAQRGQRALQRTPPSVPEARSDTNLVRAIVHGALAERREILTEPEAKRVLAAYGIPVVPTEIARDAAEAAGAATTAKAAGLVPAMEWRDLERADSVVVVSAPPAWSDAVFEVGPQGAAQTIAID